MKGIITRRTAVALAANALLAACGFALAGCDRKIEQAHSSDDIRVALLAGTGGVNDGTLSEMDYKTLVSYCGQHNIPFRYYQHTKENKVESEVVVDAAVADGYNVIISADYTYASVLVDAQKTYPEVLFVALDCTKNDFSGVDLESNLVAVAFEERLSGFFAGYAAVAMGYTHLGYLGGLAIPAVLQFEYGFTYGANQAAKDRGINDVKIEVVMGNQFFGDSDITAYLDTWYQSLGVQCVFSCGGGIYVSNAEAAAKVKAKTIGVDSDQKKAFDAYGQDMCITSAIKNCDAAIRIMMDAIRVGNFNDYGGKAIVLGLESASDLTRNCVGLPLESTQWTDSFTKEDYLEVVSKVYNGEFAVPTEQPDASQLVVTVEDHGSIK